MFDAWSIAGVGGGSAALTYLASGWRQVDGKQTLRLSLDKSGSLLGDVRLLGGGLSLLTAMYAKGTTKKTLQVVGAASLLSLVQTEVIRWRLVRQGNPNIAGSLPLAPGYKFGALPGPSANANSRARQRQGSWARQ